MARLAFHEPIIKDFSDRPSVPSIGQLSGKQPYSIPIVGNRSRRLGNERIRKDHGRLVRSGDPGVLLRRLQWISECAQVVLWAEDVPYCEDMINAISHGDAWIAMTGQISLYNGVPEINFLDGPVSWTYWTR